MTRGGHFHLLFSSLTKKSKFFFEIEIYLLHLLS